MKKSLKIVIGIASFAVIVLVSYFIYLLFIPNFSNKGTSKQYIYLRNDATYDDVIKQLKEKSNIRSTYTFEQALKLLKSKNNIKAGCYLVKDGVSNYALLRALRNGNQTPIQLKINNIRTKEQLAGSLSKQLMSDSLQFIHLLNDTVFLSQYNLTPITCVSVFLPNTYQIFWNASPQKVFERMNKEYNMFWNKERRRKASEIPLTQLEVITLASIVDSESNTSYEKPIIAGLYINRLRKNMPLQADPTIVFAVGDFTIKRVLISHTSINSPYNTYKNTGLPPGPIRIPTLKAIDAVLNYDKNDYVYMCAKETLNGEHNFASSYSQHIDNANKYQKALNERGIR